MIVPSSFSFNCSTSLLFFNNESTTPSALFVSYPKKSVAPKRSFISNQISSTELSPEPFQFFLAKFLLSFIKD